MLLLYDFQKNQYYILNYLFTIQIGGFLDYLQYAKYKFVFAHQDYNMQTLRMKLKTFTHDYYIMSLPPSSNRKFYKHFPIYHVLRNFRNQKIKIAPIARIYGTNQFGQKCCCHIHGYFPFFYIKLEELADYMKEQINQFQFLNTLEQLYQSIYKSSSPIIFKCQYQEKFDFYGYHQKMQPFLKIFFYDPVTIGRMRALLDSKIINNKKIQCYEGHINYFMQLYSDLNIFGIHQISLSNFTFRKNPDNMKIFSKFQPKIIKGLMKQGWNLIQLAQLYPKYFNLMHKYSSCYIELDLNFQSILNFYQKNIENDSQQDQNEEEKIKQAILLSEKKHLVKLKVQLTTSLKQLWQDEKKRRNNFGINHKLTSYVDYSKNLQAQSKPQQTFNVQVNFIKKSNNFKDLLKMIQTYKNAQCKKEKKKIQISYSTVDLQQNLSKEKQKLLQKVQNKWKFYLKRKKKIISQILRGDRQQLPEWSDQQHCISASSEDSENQNEIQQQNLNNNQNLIQNAFQIMQRPETNTSKYRNNFASRIHQVKKQLMFCDECVLCKQIWNNCWCKYLNLELISQINQQECNCILQFKQNPPQYDQLQKQQIKYQHQRPFYADFQDLLLSYNLEYFQPTLKICQYVTKLTLLQQNEQRNPITIKNQLKFPYFFQVSELPTKQEIMLINYRFQFQQNAPTQQQIQQQSLQKMQDECSQKKATMSLAKFEDTFVSDLIILKFQIFVEVGNKKKFYANCLNDQIKAIYFQISNYQKFYCRIKCLIYQDTTFIKENVCYNQYQQVFCVKNQAGLLSLFILIIFKIDPDLIISFDQQKYGMRYLVNRGVEHQINFDQLISRSGVLQQILKYANFKDYTHQKQTFLKFQDLSYGQFNEEKQNLVQQFQKTQRFIQEKEQIKSKIKTNSQGKEQINIQIQENLQNIIQIQENLQSNMQIQEKLQNNMQIQETSQQTKTINKEHLKNVQKQNYNQLDTIKQSDKYKNNQKVGSILESDFKTEHQKKIIDLGENKKNCIITRSKSKSQGINDCSSNSKNQIKDKDYKSQEADSSQNKIKNQNQNLSVIQSYEQKKFLFDKNKKKSQQNQQNKPQQDMNDESNKSKSNSNKKKTGQKKRQKIMNFNVKGRVILNLFRFCQQQLKLKSYTLQNIARQMFNTQLPQFTDQALNQFKNQKFVQKYFIDKLQVVNLILHQLNIIGSIVEKSKIYGADFISMMERGTQFKIQSVMCRVTKKKHFLNLSASKYQVGNQSILQCRPLVIQPPKQFYEQPVLLFDFQSLYPSIMIAYNICYSTCLGSLKQMFKDGKLKKMGVSEQLSIDLENFLNISQESNEGLGQQLQQLFFITPNKVIFVKKNVREGLLPKILLQFLLTRIMIKDSTKLYKKQSILHNLKQRQIALKLFMNVMFGYTGASFSGRMPCSQIADSVVQTAKYCLKKSIDYLNQHLKYKGKVIYGDTDSMFFHLPSKRISECFQIGKQLASEITKLFPYPIQMKFQKVYQSLVLVSKKRYYGKSFQTKQSKPKYQGKGLQCVRRDGIDLTSKLMKKMIDLLMDKKDLSAVKNLFTETYYQAYFGYLHQNYFVLSKQVKLLKYSQKSMPAHGHAALRFKKIDVGLIPKYGQRMKYIVNNQLRQTVKEKSIPLFEHFKIKQHQLDYQYYCDKLFLPPLHRVFCSMLTLNNFLFKIQQINQEQLSEEKLKKVKKQKAKNKLYLQNMLKNIKTHQKEITKIHSKSEQICKNCAHFQSYYKLCIQYNCPNLYIRNRIQAVESNFKFNYSKIINKVQEQNQNQQEKISQQQKLNQSNIQQQAITQVQDYNQFYDQELKSNASPDQELESNGSGQELKHHASDQELESITSDKIQMNDNQMFPYHICIPKRQTKLRERSKIVTKIQHKETNLKKYQ